MNSVKCKDIVGFFECMAPSSLAEQWDNVGLLLGSEQQCIKRILVCLDVTCEVVDEAIKQEVDLIISHHPLIFKGMKRIISDEVKGSVIYKLIKNDISVYSAHTNLDMAKGGVNDKLANVIGLQQLENLNVCSSEKLYKIVVFMPQESVDKVREAMTSAGAGCIGNYSDCSFVSNGTGTFRPLDGTNPYIGSVGNLEKVSESRIETIVPHKLLNEVINKMIKAHPYEEVAYDVYKLEKDGQQYGLGKVGLLETAMDIGDFVKHIKNVLKVDTLKVIGTAQRNIKKVAVFCGSFDENYTGILKSDADVLVTGDIKYHTAVDISQMGLCVIDAGHFSTERVIISEVAKIIRRNFEGIEVIESKVEKDPIKFS